MSSPPDNYEVKGATEANAATTTTTTTPNAKVRSMSHDESEAGETKSITTLSSSTCLSLSETTNSLSPNDVRDARLFFSAAPLTTHSEHVEEEEEEAEDDSSSIASTSSTSSSAYTNANVAGSVASSFDTPPLDNDNDDMSSMGMDMDTEMDTAMGMDSPSLSWSPSRNPSAYQSALPYYCQNEENYNSLSSMAIQTPDKTVLAQTILNGRTTPVHQNQNQNHVHQEDHDDGDKQPPPQKRQPPRSPTTRLDYPDEHPSKKPELVPNPPLQATTRSNAGSMSTRSSYSALLQKLPSTSKSTTSSAASSAPHTSTALPATPHHPQPLDTTDVNWMVKPRDAEVAVPETARVYHPSFCGTDFLQQHNQQHSRQSSANSFTTARDRDTSSGSISNTASRSNSSNRSPSTATTANSHPNHGKLSPTVSHHSNSSNHDPEGTSGRLVGGNWLINSERLVFHRRNSSIDSNNNINVNVNPMNTSISSSTGTGDDHDLTLHLNPSMTSVEESVGTTDGGTTTATGMNHGSNISTSTHHPPHWKQQYGNNNNNPSSHNAIFRHSQDGPDCVPMEIPVVLPESNNGDKTVDVQDVYQAKTNPTFRRSQPSHDKNISGSKTILVSRVFSADASDTVPLEDNKDCQVGDRPGRSSSKPLLLQGGTHDNRENVELAFDMNSGSLDSKASSSVKNGSDDKDVFVEPRDDDDASSVMSEELKEFFKNAKQIQDKSIQDTEALVRDASTSSGGDKVNDSAVEYHDTVEATKSEIEDTADDEDVLDDESVRSLREELALADRSFDLEESKASVMTDDATVPIVNNLSLGSFSQSFDDPEQQSCSIQLPFPWCTPGVLTVPHSELKPPTSDDIDDSTSSSVSVDKNIIEPEPPDSTYYTGVDAKPPDKSPNKPRGKDSEPRRKRKPSILRSIQYSLSPKHSSPVSVTDKGICVDCAKSVKRCKCDSTSVANDLRLKSIYSIGGGGSSVKAKKKKKMRGSQTMKVKEDADPKASLAGSPLDVDNAAHEKRLGTSTADTTATGKPRSSADIQVKNMSVPSPPPPPERNVKTRSGCESSKFGKSVNHGTIEDPLPRTKKKKRKGKRIWKGLKKGFRLLNCSAKRSTKASF